MSETLTIEVADGSFNCYVARPANVASAPVIVVLQEIFGVNAGIRSIADDYAATLANARTDAVFKQNLS